MIYFTIAVSNLNQILGLLITRCNKYNYQQILVSEIAHLSTESLTSTVPLKFL